MKQDNFENIKVGDVVILTTYSFGGSTKHIKRVERVTKTRFIVNGIEFKKDTGKVYGSHHWCDPDVSYPKDGEIEKITKENIIRNIFSKVKEIKIEDLTYEKALQLNEIFGFVTLEK
jgi:hypothetical protein